MKLTGARLGGRKYAKESSRRHSPARPPPSLFTGSCPGMSRSRTRNPHEQIAYIMSVRMRFFIGDETRDVGPGGSTPKRPEYAPKGDRFPDLRRWKMRDREGLGRLVS